MNFFRFNKLIVAVIFLSFYQFAMAQNGRVENLLSQLSAHPAKDTVRVNLLNQIASEYSFSNNSLAQYFAENALDLSQSLNYVPGEIKAMHVKGDVLRQGGYYEQALNIYLQALSLANNNHNASSASELNQSVGELYSVTGNVASAESSYQEALQLGRQLNDTLQIIDALGSLGKMQVQLSNQQSQNNNYTSALDNFTQQYNYSIQKNYAPGIADASDNLGYVYYLLGDQEKATFYFGNALNIFQRINDQRRVAKLYLEMGNVQLKETKYDDAAASFNKSFSMATQQNNARLLMENYLQLSVLDALKGQAVAALHNKEMYEFLRDSLYGEQQNRALADLQIRYKTKNREQDITQLKKQQQTQQEIIRQQRYWQIAIGCIVILLALGAILIYRTSRTRKQLNDELEQKNMDVEQRKQEVEGKNKELEKLNKIKDRILSVISHDIRNPLASMEMMLELMKTGELSMEEITMVTDSLSESLNETKSFLDNLLQWSKNQMVGIQPKTSSILLKEVVEENIRFFKWNAGRKKVMLIDEVPKTVKVRADREMLKIIFRNLTSNAIKFSLENGYILFGAGYENSAIKIWVKDNGVGIKPADHGKVFGMDSFTSKGTANEIGTGLGLMLCKDFIETNGGKIWFESKETQGTTFYFTLPVATVKKDDEETEGFDAGNN